MKITRKNPSFKYILGLVIVANLILLPSIQCQDSTDDDSTTDNTEITPTEDETTISSSDNSEQAKQQGIDFVYNLFDNMWPEDSKTLTNQMVYECTVNADFNALMNKENPDSDALSIQDFVYSKRIQYKNYVSYGSSAIYGLSSFGGATNYQNVLYSLQQMSTELQLYMMSWNLTGCNKTHPIHYSQLKNVYDNLATPYKLVGQNNAIFLMNSVNCTQGMNNSLNYLVEQDYNNTAVELGKLLSNFINLKLSSSSVISEQDEKFYFLLNRMIQISPGYFSNNALLHDYVVGKGESFFSQIDSQLTDYMSINDIPSTLKLDLFNSLIQYFKYHYYKALSFASSNGFTDLGEWNSSNIECFDQVAGKLFTSEAEEWMSSLINAYWRKSFGEMSVYLKMLLKIQCESA
eukprot:403353877